MFLSHSFSTLTDGHLGCFPILAIVIGTNNIEGQMSIQRLLVSLPPLKYLLIELQIIWVFDFYVFEKLSCFSHNVPTNIIWGYPFLYILASIVCVCVLKKLFYLLLCVWGGVACACVCWRLWKPDMSPGIQVVVNCLAWVLEIVCSLTVRNFLVISTRQLLCLLHNGLR